jgi:large repetitive protein
MVVGDIARYRYWPVDEAATFVRPGRQGAPGIHPVRNDLRVLPFTAGGATPRAPNGGTQSDPARPIARAVPAVLAQPDPADPHTAEIVAAPRGLVPSDRALVPTSPTSERVLSTYVAFSRPGSHRVTTGPVGGAERAQDLHDRGHAGTHPLEFWEQQGLQTLYFDVEVAPVTVAIAGREVADGDTVELLVHQQAAVTVTPTEGGRVYAIGVADPGAGLVRSPRRSVLAAGPVASPAGSDPVVVEISRLHEVGDEGYASGGLAAFGYHLGGDVHVPVRRLGARVTDRLVARASADPASPVTQDLHPGGSVVVFVPAELSRALEVVSVDGAVPPADAPQVVHLAEPGDAARRHLGVVGQAFEVRAPSAAPPADRDVVLEAVVTDGTTPATVRCALTWRVG